MIDNSKMEKLRRFVFTVLVVFVYFAFAPADVFAQKSFDEEYNEYRLRLEVYDKDHEVYVLKRSSYLRFRTLKSEEEAYDATLKLLQSRDDVIVSYLEALMVKLNTSAGVIPDMRDELNALINRERDWYVAHRGKLPSAGNLGDLFADSDEASARFGLVSFVSYKTQAAISVGKILDFNERTREVFEGLKAKLGSIKGEARAMYMLSNREMQLIDRWMLESENRIIRGEERRQAGVDIAVNLKADRADKVLSDYNTSLAVLAETQVFFREVTSFMTEVVREIMVAE